MSIIKKTPYVETMIKAYNTTTLNNLLTQLNTSSANIVEAGFGNLPNDLVATCRFNLFGNCYVNAILVREENKPTHLIKYDTSKQDLVIYKLDLTTYKSEEVREYLNINELRRVINDVLYDGVVEITGQSILGVLDTTDGDLDGELNEDGDLVLSIKDGAISVATPTSNGLMSSTDKIKLNGLTPSHLEGLNVLCVGDSITAGQGMTTNTRWANVMATKYHWNLTVSAQGGISMSNYYYKENDLAEVGCVSKIDVIATMNPKPDLVIVWGGHNDAVYRPSPLGSFDNVAQQDTNGALPTYADRYSFKGSIRYICEAVHNYAPEATLVFLTTEWLDIVPRTLLVPEGTTDTSADFNKAIMENGWRYGYVPINMSLCGITPYTKGSTTSDNVHPNDEGTKLIVKYLSDELNKIYYIYDIQNVQVTGITLNKQTTTILSGQTEQLSAIISPQDATNKNINWSSSNDSVATVNSSGLVTGVANGTATITATTVDGGYTATCSVVIQTQVVNVSGVSLNVNNLSLVVGESYELVATITPANATNQKVVWTSSDDQVIDVQQQNGHITALNSGTGTVTVTTVDGSYTATCSITISQVQNYYVLEALNSTPHADWTPVSVLGLQYFAFDGQNSIEQLSGKEISKIWFSVPDSISVGSSRIISFYDITLVNGEAPAPENWVKITDQTFTDLSPSQKVEWTLTSPHTVQAGHTIGIKASGIITTYSESKISIGLASHYFSNISGAGTSITLNAYDFYVDND